MIDEKRLNLLIDYYSAIVADIKKHPLPGDFTEEKEDVVAALRELKAWREARKMMEKLHDGSPQQDYINDNHWCPALTISIGGK